MRCRVPDYVGPYRRLQRSLTSILRWETMGFLQGAVSMIRLTF